MYVLIVIKWVLFGLGYWLISCGVCVVILLVDRLCVLFEFKIVVIVYIFDIEDVGLGVWLWVLVFCDFELMIGVFFILLKGVFVSE